MFVAEGLAQNLNCDFENDFCSWTQPADAKRDWSRMKGKTFTSGTGPSGDHTTGSEYIDSMGYLSTGSEYTDSMGYLSTGSEYTDSMGYLSKGSEYTDSRGYLSAGSGYTDNMGYVSTDR